MEKSLDGRLFTEFAQVSAQGSEQSGASYLVFDPSPAVGSNIYRIRQVDQDGAFAYSDLLRLEKSQWAAPYEFHLGPVPVHQQVNIFLEGNWTYPMSGRILDTQGREVHTFFLENQNDLQVNGVEFLPPGAYFLQLNQQDIWISKVFTKY